MPIHDIQPSFAGGEFSPALYSRVDLQKYSTGLKKAKNLIIHPHGGASNRPGTKYMATAKDSTKATRLVPFEFSTTQAYVIEFGNTYVRFYTSGGQIAVSSPAAWDAGTTYAVGDYVTSGGTIYRAILAGINHVPPNATYWVAQSIYEVTTPYAAADLAALKFVQSADVLYIVHPSYAPRTLTRYGNTDWRLATITFINGPFMLSNADLTKTITASTPGGSPAAYQVSLASSSAFFDSGHVGALLRLNYKVDGQTVSQAITSSVATTTLECKGTWRLITHGTWGANLTIERSFDAGSTWKTIRVLSSGSDANFDISGTEPDLCIIRANFSGFSAGICRVDLSVDPFEKFGIVKITSVTNSTTAAGNELLESGGTSYGKQLLRGTATSDWAEGSWSDYRGYPACVQFFQDRSAYAASPAEPQTLWLSRTGLYTDFGRSDPLLDSDGITVNLPNRKVNKILNLVALSDILAFTSSTEWAIGPSQTGPLSPTNIEAKSMGYRGSIIADPVVVGNRLLFVQAMGSVVRDLGFDLAQNGYAGDNLSIASSHLFEGYSIVEMAYQQEPHSIVWIVRSDGVLLALTYLREQEVLAWTWADTVGTFESVCSISGVGFNEVWFVVKRGSSRFIERMVQRMASTDVRDQYFVDCGISYDSPVVVSGATRANPVVITAVAHGYSNGDLVDISDVVGMTQLNNKRFKVANKTTDTFELTTQAGVNVDGTAYTAYSSAGKARKAATSLTGYDHLNGLTVSILSDGDVQTQQVVSGGAVTLSPAGSRVHIGLPYTADLQTLNIELNIQGTIQDKKVRVPQVTFRLDKSRGGVCGPDDSKLTESIIDRDDGDDADEPVPLKTRDIKTVIPAGDGNRGSVFFRQADPLPTTILAVIPQVSVNG